MRVAHLFAGIAVADRAAAIEWYSRLFGAPPGMLPNEEEAAWRMTETSSVYVRVDSTRAGGGITTVVVDRLDLRLQEMAQRGITSEDVADVGDAGRKASFRDPDGNTIEIVELR